MTATPAVLSRFAETAAAIAATSRKSEREQILALYLRSLDDPSLERAAVFFTGSAFPRREEPVHVVEPQIVLEIAFDHIQESKRHKSGYALRFPRITRIRDDKTATEISALDEVRRIYEGQIAREEG